MHSLQLKNLHDTAKWVSRSRISSGIFSPWNRISFNTVQIILHHIHVQKEDIACIVSLTSWHSGSNWFRLISAGNENVEKIVLNKEDILIWRSYGSGLLTRCVAQSTISLPSLGEGWTGWIYHVTYTVIYNVWVVFRLQIIFQLNAVWTQYTHGPYAVCGVPRYNVHM